MRLRDNLHYDKHFKVFIGDYRKTGSNILASRDLYSKTPRHEAGRIVHSRTRSTVFIAAPAAAKEGAVPVKVARAARVRLTASQG